MNYLVIRHGANAYNQSMEPRAVLGIVEGEDLVEATATANNRWTTYNNQWLELQTIEKASAEDWNEGVERGSWGFYPQS
jgi:hypothetical protein